MAYHQWLLDRNKIELFNLWEEYRNHATEIIETLELDALDDLVLQGFQTIKFGTELYREFAETMGLDPDSTPITLPNVEEAIRYVAAEGHGAEHQSHLDRLLGIMSRAAKADYLEPLNHYKLINEDEPNAELRVHLPSTFDKIRKYAREHDLENSSLLSNVNDYKARISDAADDPTSYITTHSQNTPPINRCVGIHINDAAELIEDFEPEAFGLESESTETHDSVEPTPIKDLHKTKKGYVTVTGTIQEVEYPASDDAPGLKERS